VQATVVQKADTVDANGDTVSSQDDPEITQFISDDGTVIDGAMGLRATYTMMIASLIATVALS